ncbi:MAG: CDGSH iron-sulfur domain-containing protein [Ignavibacteriaceae bacterium]
MEEPFVAQKSPFGVTLQPGKYAWCACGKSAKQPFCDGTHKGSGFSPKVFEVTETKEVWLCGCKHSKNAPFCDGTHKTL